MELQYYIDSDFVMNYTKDSKKDYTSAIANAYVDYANNGVDQKTIWKDVSTKSEDKYLAELVSAYNCCFFQLRDLNSLHHRSVVARHP